MLLLIPSSNSTSILFPLEFTLHFATINTELHSRTEDLYDEFTLHFATINTKILDTFNGTGTTFTLHFATINTTVFFLIY